MKGESAIKVLIVDDEEIVRDFLIRFMSFHGIEARGAQDGYKGTDLMKQELFDVAFIEVRMPEIDGLQTFRELKKINPDVKYIMMSGDHTDCRLETARKEGASTCFKKPFDMGELKMLVQALRLETAQAPWRPLRLHAHIFP